MPIEIKELHIRVNVNSEDCEPGQEQNIPGHQQSPAGGNMDRFVEQCVERVLEVIKREKQR